MLGGKGSGSKDDVRALYLHLSCVVEGHVIQPFRLSSDLVVFHSVYNNPFASADDECLSQRCGDHRATNLVE